MISFTLILLNQNYSLLSNAYERIKTYTGTVLENIADGIIVVSKKGIISVFNKAAEQVFRKSSQQMIGKSLDELNPDMMKILNDNFTQTNQELTLKIPVETDRTRLISLRFSKITEGNDSTIFVVRDMTEIKLMEENIKRTEQLTAMGKLASAVAHEVRNPLNAISIIGQRLGREFKPAQREEEYSKLVDLVKSESLRLNGIVEEFLKFARPPRLNRQPTDMAQLLNETIAMIEVQTRDHNIEVKKIYSDLGYWTVDREQLKQALLNLFLNGIEAMPKGGILSIKGYVNENGLYIDISDTGKGIPEEDQNRIFDLYFTTKETGTGLGLSIVQRIIMEHGGWVRMDSILDRGTTFSIYIP